MQTEFASVPHRISFYHHMEYQLIGEGEFQKKIPIPFSIQVYTDKARPITVRLARAVTTCRILVGTKDSMQVIMEAQSVCSWSEQSFNKEFARQLSLARVLEQLSRPMGVALLVAYLKSKPTGRKLCNLLDASRGKYRTLSGALSKE